MRDFQTKYSDHILTVTLSRPKALNALNLELLEGLRGIIQELYQNNDTKGLILTGDGDKAFVAGADIKEITSLTPDQAHELSKRGQELFKLIENCPKPVIAAVNGFALGGGCELAMACHIRIATENAKFGQPEVTLGLIPGYGGTQRLPQLIGRGKALELMLTADMISAQEAKALGLVNHVVSNKDDLMDLADAIMKKIIANAPGAITKIIRSVNAGYEFENAGYESEAENFAACTETEDFKEGTNAFIQKKKPNFTGK
ncbi:MAG TPA: enoyl-CoA hydratase-related protein [Chryseolinea sp.]|nr:enoyl-CoA hydratase-related protein [Chryseolinea sp.]